jgi:putative endonuclease
MRTGIAERALRLLAQLFAGRGSHYRGRRGLGQRWERLAEKRLRAEGYVIRERNYTRRGRRGEIDLVAEENGVLCFVEVKGRSGSGFGAPEDAVTEEKQRRIAAAAGEYLWRRRLPASVPCRFDVVSVIVADGLTRVTILRDAFPLPEDPAPRRVLN